MLSKRSQEGYLLIDNRCNEGIPVEFARRAGMDDEAARGKFECATITCKHCGKVQIMNRERQRDRGYCRKCDHYICDEWACRQGCNPLEKYLELLQRKPIDTSFLRNSICGF